MAYGILKVLLVVGVTFQALAGSTVVGALTLMVLNGLGIVPIPV